MLPRLYPITDTRLSGLSHAEQVRRLVEGGALFIQLRDKQAAPRDFYHAALEAMRIARERGARLIVNDRVDIALAVDADGVHLGQDDLPVEHARRLLGPGKIIGYSTHNLKQALEADSMPIDYIAVGPIFGTATKENPDPVVGLNGLREIRARITHPLVAIGGITRERAASVLEAGADSLAVIADLYARGDITARVREFLKSGC